MVTVANLEDSLPTLSKPYTISRSRLDTVTKIITKKFVCNDRNLKILNESVFEKLRTFAPNQGGFSYLISFTDKTHFENSDISLLTKTVEHSDKCTNRLILSWSITHDIEGEENELSVIVRLSNPINPFIYLQAALSKSPDELDNIEMSDGSVSISVVGAGQTPSEEIFQLVEKWVDSCPQPQTITSISDFTSDHMHKIRFLNYWIFPIILIIGFCAYLFKVEDIKLILILGLIGVVIHEYVRGFADFVNGKLDSWTRISKGYSIFDLSGGDSNQHTEYLSKSNTNLIKIILVIFLSFILNIVAGLFSAKIYGVL